LPFVALLAGKGNKFWHFPRFSLPFGLLASGKGNGFCWVSLFALPFALLLMGKGNFFRPLPSFALPFQLLASFKSIGFRWGSLFALPFALLMWFVSLDKEFLFLQAESNLLSETDLFRQKKTFRARETHAQKVLFNNFCSVDPGFLRIVLTKSTPDFYVRNYSLFAGCSYPTMYFSPCKGDLYKNRLRTSKDS